MERHLLADSRYSVPLAAPLADVDLADWLFTLTDDLTPVQGDDREGLTTRWMLSRFQLPSRTSP